MEEWRDIPGYETYYQASSLGNIRRLNSIVAGRCNTLRRLAGDVLKLQKNSNGYITVGFCINHSCKYQRVHRLVCMAFHPNSENKKFVNHKDGNKTNNHIDNLEWCTKSENEIHAYKTGLKNPPCAKSMLGRFGALHNTSRAVLQFNLNGQFIKEYGSGLEAYRCTNILAQNINKCCKGIYQKSGGYIWKYKNEKCTPQSNP